MRHALILILLLPLFTGCDPVFGISRRARVSFMPAPATVGTVIREVPGIDEVHYRSSEGDRPLTLTGVQPPDQIHTFSYWSGSNVQASLQFVVDYQGSVEYSQSYIRLGTRPSPERIAATRRMMLAIEQSLEQNCGLTNLSVSVEETCLGVKCK